MKTHYTTNTTITQQRLDNTPAHKQNVVEVVGKSFLSSFGVFIPVQGHALESAEVVEV